MFSKLLRHSKACSLFSTYAFFNRNSSTMPHPLLFKSFPNILDSSSYFVIKQIEAHELDEASNCITDAFISREFITKNYKIQSQQVVEKVRKDLEKALKDNLCFVCKDEKSGKLAGVVYYEDLSDRVDPKIWQVEVAENENLRKCMEFYEYCYSMISSQAEPKERNDVMMLKKLAVAEEFTNLGVASNLIFAGRYIHPRTTKAKKSLMIVSNEKTCNYLMKHGWELIREVNVKDYQKNEFEDSGTVFLMKYEPKYVKSLIQELKSLFEN